MKHRYDSNSGVIEFWLKCNRLEVETGGRNKRNNLYFEGDILYSCGNHYPLAKYIKMKNIKDLVLINKEDSTRTTNRHKSMLASYLDNWRWDGYNIQPFFVKSLDNMELNVYDYKERIEKQISELLRSRDVCWIITRMNKLKLSIIERNKFVKKFNLNFSEMEVKDFCTKDQIVKLVVLKLTTKL